MVTPIYQELFQPVFDPPCSGQTSSLHCTTEIRIYKCNFISVKYATLNDGQPTKYGLPALGLSVTCLVKSVLHSFYDCLPTGKILRNYIGDIWQIHELLLWVWSSYVQSFKKTKYKCLHLYGKFRLSNQSHAILQGQVLTFCYKSSMYMHQETQQTSSMYSNCC
jgi:hypothetical protein